MYEHDTVVVYMDAHDRCRTLVNPKNIEKYINKENVAVNPPIAEALSRGITPDMWYVEESKLKFRKRKLEVDVTKLDIYEMYIDISDLKEELSTWIESRMSETEQLLQRVQRADRQLKRLYRFVLSLRISIVLVLVLCILFTSVVIGAGIVY